MADTLARNWWAMLVRGIAAIVFGAFAFLFPGAAFAALVIIFAAYALVDGIFSLVAAVRAAEAHQRWGALFFSGIFGVLIAAVTFFALQITALAIVYLIAFWALVTGVLELTAAFQLRRQLAGEIWWILAGLASIAFGILLLWRPLSGALAVVWLIGAYAIAFGIFRCGLAFRLRNHLRRVPAAALP